MACCRLVKFYKLRGMYLVSWFPCVVAFGVSFPFDEILEAFRSSKVLVCDDLFYFEFFFSFDKVRGWMGKVRAMCGCFMVGV